MASCHLLQLPTDIISHVLSYIMFMHHKSRGYILKISRFFLYIKSQGSPIHYRTSDCDRIDKMCCDYKVFFSVHKALSPMSEMMLLLSMIHPKIRQILKNACEWIYCDRIRRWHFKKHFFRMMLL